VGVEKLGDLKESNTLPPSKQSLQLLIANHHLLVCGILKAKSESVTQLAKLLQR
jgi:hypothetical protein